MSDTDIVPCDHPRPWWKRLLLRPCDACREHPMYGISQQDAWEGTENALGPNWEMTTAAKDPEPGKSLADLTEVKLCPHVSLYGSSGIRHHRLSAMCQVCGLVSNMPSTQGYKVELGCHSDNCGYLEPHSHGFACDVSCECMGKGF